MRRLVKLRKASDLHFRLRIRNLSAVRCQANGFKGTVLVMGSHDLKRDGDGAARGTIRCL